MKKNHLWWRFSVFLMKKSFFLYIIKFLPYIYKIRYMLICKNNGKFAYNLLSADGVYVNN